MLQYILQALCHLQQQPILCQEVQTQFHLLIQALQLLGLFHQVLIQFQSMVLVEVEATVIVTEMILEKVDV